MSDALPVSGLSVPCVAQASAVTAPLVPRRRSRLPRLPPKARPAKVRPAKVRPAKVRPAKVRPAKVRPAKVRPAKVRPAKVRPAKARPRQGPCGSPRRLRPADHHLHT
ncbi:hypothetical protein GCM10027087_13490 [Paractinoplanes abujensis]